MKASEFIISKHTDFPKETRFSFYEIELITTWMEQYHKYLVNNDISDIVIEEFPQCNKSKWGDCECENECRRGLRK